MSHRLLDRANGARSSKKRSIEQTVPRSSQQRSIEQTALDRAKSGSIEPRSNKKPKFFITFVGRSAARASIEQRIPRSSKRGSIEQPGLDRAKGGSIKLGRCATVLGRARAGGLRSIEQLLVPLPKLSRRCRVAACHSSTMQTICPGPGLGRRLFWKFVTVGTRF